MKEMKIQRNWINLYCHSLDKFCLLFGVLDGLVLCNLASITGIIELEKNTSRNIFNSGNVCQTVLFFPSSFSSLLRDIRSSRNIWTSPISSQSLSPLPSSPPSIPSPGHKKEVTWLPHNPDLKRDQKEFPPSTVKTKRSHNFPIVLVQKEAQTRLLPSPTSFQIAMKQ